MCSRNSYRKVKLNWCMLYTLKAFIIIIICYQTLVNIKIIWFHPLLRSHGVGPSQLADHALKWSQK